MTQLRAVIYARYSSDLQREESIEDQVEVCRRYAQAQGWRLVNTYSDAALSGASRHRPSYQALIADARKNQFDIVVCEAVDRLGRRLADTADLQDILAFLGIRLFTPSVGEVTALHVAIMGMMAQMTLRDIADKTKRGQLGRIRKGKVPSGLAYGYRIAAGADGDGGHRSINPAEAQMVRRIFNEYATGIAPEKIARDLNMEGIPGPGGRHWSNTTIRGQSRRGTGILNNSLYRGLLEWNRCSYVKDPATGKRVARPNPPEKLETCEVPELRIVDDDIWHSVKQQQGKIRLSLRGQAGIKAGAARHDLYSTHRARFLLSGLLKCACCGGNLVIMGKDRFGCSTRRRQGTCTNALSITRQSIEARVLVGLKERLVTPELLSIFVKEFQAEYARLRSEALASHDQTTKLVADVEKKIKAIMVAIEDGFYQPEMKGRMDALVAEKARLLERASSGELAEKLVLHPRMHELYARKVRELDTLFQLGGVVGRTAMETIRSLITKVTVGPSNASDGYDAVLHGDLAVILRACDEAGRSAGLRGSRPPGEIPPEGQLSMVAGARFELTTFRL
ncbi:MAG: recombinase family protein [Aestuariivirga sp.]